FVVGIDLGTTHTVVAHADLDGDNRVVDDPLAQTTAPGETAALPQLASAVYLPSPNEFADGKPFVGAFARAHGAKVPGRLIVSAKSWLCVAGVDRTAPILPWAGVDGVHKLSPVDVQAMILTHVKRAWDRGHANAPLAEQD